MGDPRANRGFLRRFGPTVLARAGAAIAAGAGTTILVASGLAAFLPFSNGHYRIWGADIPGLPTRPGSLVLQPEDDRRWIAVYDYERPGMVRRWWIIHVLNDHHTATIPLDLQDYSPSPPRLKGSPPTWGSVLPTLNDLTATGVEGFDDARGWPALALWCSLSGDGFINHPASVTVDGGIAISEQSPYVGKNRVLPLRPLWRGFAIDTAVFAAAWLALLPLGGLAARSIRATLRRRRNLCPSCGYSLAGLAEGSACPECGR